MRFGGVIIVADFGGRVGLVGHQYPVHQVDAADFDIAFFGNPQHQFLEAGEAQLALVKAGNAADEALLEGGQQQGMAGRPLGADNVLDGADDFRQLVAARIGQGRRGRGASDALRGAARRNGFRLNGVNVGVVENQAVHMVGHTTGGSPGYSDHQHALAHGAEGVDDMDEVGIAGDEDKGVDVREVVGRVNAVGGHLHIDAVFDADGAAGVVRTPHRQARGNVHRLDAGGVERGRVVDELTGALELGGAANPVGVGFANHDAAVVGDLFFERRNVGGSTPRRQTDFEVFPVDE